MRAAIYIRVSTERQVEGVSLDIQKQLCIARAKELGYDENNYDIFEEAGRSGEDIDIRPEMKKLRELVSEKVYSHVVCYHPDRFSRDMTDKLIVCREFEKNGADLVFSDVEYENSPEGKLFFNIMSAIAEYEHGLIKKRTIRGRLGRVRNHKEIMPMRVPPFGYDWVDKQLVINQEEAEYVKLIYLWYTYDKLTLREIGEKLFNLGVFPKRKESKSWHASSISRILSSEIYNGRYYYNKRKVKKVRGATTEKGNPKKTYEIRDEDDWLLVEVPAIIDDDLWNIAQKQRAKNKTFSGNVKYQYLLKSLLKCKNCGRTWNGQAFKGRKKKDGGYNRYFTYRCPNKNPKKYGEEFYEDCKHHSIRTDLIENHIWNDIIVPIIYNPEKLSRELDKKNSSAGDNIDIEMNALMASIKNREDEKGRIKKMFRLGVIDEDEMLKDMKVVNEEIKNIQYDISLLKAKKDANTGIEYKKEMLMQFSKKYRDKIDSSIELDFEFKRDIITTLIDRIDISITKDREVSMDIKGTIEGLIEKDVDVVSSTQRLDIMNTTRRLEMLVKSRFVIEQILKNSRHTYYINQESVKNEYSII